MAKSSTSVSQILCGLITVIVIIAATVGIVFGVTWISIPHESSPPSSPSSLACFRWPQCESNRKTSSDAVSGFTNNTGFDPVSIFGPHWREPSSRRLGDAVDLSISGNGHRCNDGIQQGQSNMRGFGGFKAAAATDSTTCCSICFEGDKTANCFKPETCGDKKGVAGDWDYLLMDHIYVPQFCRALSGVPEENIVPHDPTLTHLKGTICVDNASKDEDIDEKWDVLKSFTIHGLWPNYFDGYPSCCGFPDPLRPSEVIEWNEGFNQLKRRWADPSDSDHGCTTCSMWNHEWQKHGGCYDNDFKKYFSEAFKIDELMYDVNVQFMSYQNQQVALTDLLSLFPNSVQIVCDPFDQSEEDQSARFLELRTCWDNRGSALHMIDCPPASANKLSFPCPAKVIL